MNADVILPRLRFRLAEQLSQPLGRDEDHVSFIQLGVDSVVATEFIEYIRAEIAPDVKVTALYDHFTLVKLAAHLATLAPAATAAETAPPPKTHVGFSGSPTPVAFSPEPASDSEFVDGIAVVGMSARFAGASNVDEYWANLRAGLCTIADIPSDRAHYWDLSHLIQREGQLCRKGGFLSDIEYFDPMFFGLSPKEAAAMDPQHRLFLQEAWRAVEDAGYSQESLAASPCGIFCGVINNDYQDLLTFSRDLTPDVCELTGNSASILASRLSYHMDLRGPAISLDTACSASLTALHLACASLKTGESDVALAGGVTLYLTQRRFFLMDQVGMLSPSSASRPFDNAADGMVPGEGVGVLVLKRLADAVAAGDSIYGVIRASGVSQAGRTNGITAPSADAQEALIRSVYARANVDPQTIDYVETHGTGTPLGDPIEVDALSRVLSGRSADRPPVTIGAVKANVGHTSGAAGVAGLIKVLLALRHRELPPLANFSTPNKHIDFALSGLRINTGVEPWPSTSGRPRRAAVSSMGFGGSNAHVMVEEAPAPVDRRAVESGQPFPILLSAKTPEALRGRATDLLAWMEKDGQGTSLSDLSFTLAVGRTALEERAGFVARDLVEVRSGLSQLAQDTAGSVPVFRARATKSGVALPPAVESIESWVKGAEVYWQALYPNARRLHLPAYPFARERYWAHTLPSPNAKPEPAAPTVPVLAADGAAAQPAMARTAGRLRLRSLAPAGSADVVESAVPASAAPPAPVLDQSAVPSPTISPPTPAPSVTPASSNGAAHSSPVPTAPAPGQGEVEETLRKLIAATLFLDLSRVSRTQRLAEMGVDSILAVELVKAINREFSLKLSAAHLYDFATIPALAGFVQEKLGAVKPPATPAPVPVSGEAVSAHHQTSAPAPAAPSPGQIDDVVRKIRGITAKVLFLDESKVGENLKFAEVGLDSILAVEMVRKLNQEFSVKLSAATLYDYPTARQLGVHVVGLVQPSAPVAENKSWFEPVLRSKTVPAAPVAENKSWFEPTLPARAAKAADDKGDRLSITGPGAVSDLKFATGPTVELGEEEVLLTVEAASVMLADILCVRGLYPTMPAYPFTPGFEIAGTVQRVGSAVTTWRPGDRVFGLTGPELGGHARAVVTDSRLLARMPEGIDFAAICTLPVSYLTARHALFGAGRLSPGERVLTHSAASCTGLAAIQLAQRAGAKLFVTAGSRERVEYLRALPGVAGAWNYREENIAARLEAELPGGRVDIVVNMLTGPVRDASLRLVAPGGRFIDLAVAGLKASAPPDLSSFVDQQVYVGVDCRRLALRDPAWVGAMLAELAADLSSGAVTPLPISAEYAWPDAKSAYRLMEEPGAVGRIILYPSRERLEAKSPTPLAAPAPSHVGAASVAPAPTPVPSRASSPAVAGPIAIVGISGRFADAPDLDTFWRNLISGRISTRAASAERLALAGFSSGPELDKNVWGGFVDGIDEFDAPFFGMARAEAEEADPQSRLFLQEVWHALEDAGFAPDQHPAVRGGIFVGFVPSGYKERAGSATAHGLAGGLGSQLAGRISYYLDWNGPALAVDTGCSSSHVAIALACASLQRGEIDIALAGGVHLTTSARVFTSITEMGMLSPTHGCRTFDASADGWLIGEGVGATVLKRLEDAVRDGDRIHGLIRGYAVNQDGVKNGLNAPKAASQIVLQRQAFASAGLTPGEVDYVEAHGMSSALADEIELNALQQTFTAHGRRSPCVISSLKSAIGHPVVAAGMAGLAKILLALRHGEIPAIAGLQTPNEALDPESAALKLSATNTLWPPVSGRPRRASLNGLSSSGTNSHLVVEEYIAPAVARPPDSSPALLILSARSESSLREMAENLRAHLVAHPELLVSEVAYSLQTGRSAMDERLALTAATASEAIEKLSAFVRGEREISGLWRGHVQDERNASADLLVSGEEGREFLAHVIRRRSLEKLARLWTMGISIDWSLLHGATKPRRVSLPGYPFARERYWHAAASSPAIASPKPAAVSTAVPVATSGAEETLRQLIASALRCPVEEIDPARDLRHYGFGSLYVLRVVEAYQAATGIALPARVFFECTTVRELAQRAEKLAPTTPVNAAPANGEAARNGHAHSESPASFPLTEGQISLWSFQQLHPDSSAYHLPIAVEWPGTVDVPRLRAALEQIAATHPALRTTFAMTGSALTQCVHPASSVGLDEEALGDSVQEEVVARLFAAGQQPFDLERGPLWRARLYSRDGQNSILLLTFHHLIFDGSSLGLFIHELDETYRTGAAPTPEIASMADHVATQLRHSGDETTRDRAYWSAQFPTGFAPLQINGRPVESAASPTTGALWHATLPGSLVASLTALATQDRVTLQSVFLAAFSALLAPRDEDGAVVVAIPVDARSADLERTVGYCVNMLPIGLSVAGRESFRDLLRTSFDRVLGALEHRRLPFRQIVRAVAENSSQTSIGAALYFQSWPSPETAALGERLVPGVHQTGELDLVFEVVETPGDWRLIVKHRLASVDAATAEELGSKYLRLLTAIAANPSAEVSALLPRRDDAESLPRFLYPEEKSALRLVEEQVRRSPESIAVVFETERLTYADLDQRATLIASHLAQAGVRRGDLVGVMLDRSASLLATLLAVWKLGAAYIPLDPVYPRDRLTAIVDDSALRFLIVEPASDFDHPHVHALKLDALLAAPAPHASPEPAGAMDLAYVIYTSGSTGQPKGVRILHRSLTHFLSCMAEKPGCTAQDYVLALTTISFDIAALELFLPLVTGACVEILPDALAKNGVRLKEKIERSPATLIQATPAGWKMLLAAGLGHVPRVRALCGGEAWDEELARQLLPRVAALWNMYGPTETTIWSSIQKVGADGRVCLGVPIGNTQFYVLDEALRPVRRGEIGELFIGGDGLADGYLNRAELTRERFLPHPARPGERMYRTGDLVRYV